LSLDTSARAASDLDRAGGIGEGPVSPLSPALRKRPLPFDAVRYTGGLLAGLQSRNSETSVPAGERHLTDEGAWINFDNAAASRRGVEYFGPIFEDGEVYKWLEAAAWSYGRTEDETLLEWLTTYTAKIAGAQSDDGYLNTFFEVAGQRAERYEQLSFDHEIFNMGAMIQAAVAQYRASGRRELLEVAIKAADHLDRTFGRDKRQGTCGHPVIEMALVELYRTTKETRYLTLAQYFIDVRGHGILADVRGHFGSAYFSDRIPVRETTTPEGHAVRALYLAAGATDVAIETGDNELLETLKLQWDNMVASKMYITGGLGARWEGEAFGDPYELPSDRAYAETCAAIASMQWSWRLYLATGDPKYADLIERQFYNAMLPGVALDGDAYFYVNALQVRDGAVIDDPGLKNPAYGRQHWFGCSCCPTNLMRTLASAHHYLASIDESGLQILQYSDATVEVKTEQGTIRLRMETNYPWEGHVAITVEETPETPWRLELRIPDWVNDGTVEIDGSAVGVIAGTLHGVARTWRQGDIVTMAFPMPPRLTIANHRVDDARGSVAIERGPLVYAIEQVDQQNGVLVDDIEMTTTTLEVTSSDILGGVPLVHFEADVVAAGPAGYSDEGAPGLSRASARVHAIPYFTWANRTVGPMRVWIPKS